jgi:hypothetical protein
MTAVLVLVLQSGAGLAAVAESNLDAAAPSPDSGCYRILFDETHGLTSDFVSGEYSISGAYSQLASYLRGQGHIGEALQDPALLNTATLDHYDVLVSVLPTEFFTVNEKADIAAFLAGGGRLVTIAENGQYPGDYRDILNDLHTSLGDGLVHNQDVIEDPTDNDGAVRRPLIHTFSGSPVNSGVESVLEVYAASILTGDALHGTAFGDGDTTTVTITAGDTREVQGQFADLQLLPSNQVNGPIVVQALAPVGAGDVFAIGDANLWDNSDLDSNGKSNLEEYDNAQLALNVFAYGQQCTQCRWALFKDRDPWPQVPILASSPLSRSSAYDAHLELNSASVDWMDPNEVVLQNWGIPYTIFRSVDIPGVDLSPYCKAIVVSDQPHALYQAISDNRTWFETWIDAGGILEFHGAAQLIEDWSALPQPGSFRMAYFATNQVTPLNLDLALFNRPNQITSAELDGWNDSVEGYLVNVPIGSIELLYHDPENQPAAVKFDLGQGCVLATLQPLEWAWDREYSRMLENYLRFDNCRADHLQFLSLVVNN